MERAYPDGITKEMVRSTVGSGYEAPHRASMSGLASDVRHRAGIDLGMSF